MGDSFAKPKYIVFCRSLGVLSVTAHLPDMVCSRVLSCKPDAEYLSRSAGFCSMTLFSFSWVDQGAIPAPISKVDLGFTIALISFAVLSLAVQFYRLRKLLAKGSAFDAHP